jgi:hypothetical protein
VGWVAIVAGVAFCVVALAMAAWVGRSSAALRRAQADLEPRLHAGLEGVEAAVARLDGAAHQAAARAAAAGEAGAKLQRSAGRLQLLSQAAGEGFAAVRGFRRWIDPAG